MQKNKLKIIFVGGGTSGHVLPNLAVIENLQKISKKKDILIDLLYVGRRNAGEYKIVEETGIKYKGIFTGKLRRYWSWKNISDLFLVLIGLTQSFFILLFNRPKLVFAKGGFVTIPFCLACTLLRVPFIIHESDSVIGLSNKILLPFAKKIYLGFPIENYRLFLPVKKSLFTGNPVRNEILNSIKNKKAFCEKYGLNEKKKIIFVFGGSQGAQRINKLVNELIPTIVKKYILIHAAGRRDESYFKEGYFDLDEKDRKDYLVFGHINQEMGEFLSNADLVISRAGANSIAELVAIKKVSILIPLPSAAGDHQKQNADFLQKNGVASVLDEGFLTTEKIYDEIDFLISDKKTRNSMVKNMKNIFPENSAKIIAEEILRII